MERSVAYDGSTTSMSARLRVNCDSDSLRRATAPRLTAYSQTSEDRVTRRSEDVSHEEILTKSEGGCLAREKTVVGEGNQGTLDPFSNAACQLRLHHRGRRGFESLLDGVGRRPSPLGSSLLLLEDLRRQLASRQHSPPPRLHTSQRNSTLT